MSGDWPTATIGEIAKVARGGSPRPITKFITNDPEGVNWIKIGDTEKGGRYITGTAEKIIRDGIKRSRWVDEGDFLLTNSMSFGRPYILKTSGCIHDGWLVLKPDYKRIDQDFLYYALSSPTTFAQFDAAAAGSTVRNLNKGLVEKVHIPLPPVEEQKRIVAVLDQAFAALGRARALAEANLADAEELHPAFVTSLLLFHEADWPTSTLGEIYDVRDGTHESPKYQQAGRSLITSKNLGRSGLNFDNVKFISEEDFVSIAKRSAVHRGDVLFAMIGTIGNPVVVDVEPDFAIKNVALFKMKDGRSGELLRHLLGSKLVQHRMASDAKGTTQRFVGLGYLRSFDLRIPNVEDEKDVVATLNGSEALSQRLRNSCLKKLEDIAALRQSLLQKAFAGELT